MRVFLALTLLMGIIRKPTIPCYGETDPLMKTEAFGKAMVRDRYQIILQFLHFADNRLYNPRDPERDRLK